MPELPPEAVPCPANPAGPAGQRCLTWGFRAALALTLCGLAPVEWGRLRQVIAAREPLVGWFGDLHLDTSPYLLLFALLLLIFWWNGGRHVSARPKTRSIRWMRWFGPQTCPATGGDSRADWRSWTLSFIVGAAAILASQSVAKRQVQERPPVRFGDLPPAYHDEFSYLFLAKTFASGRVSYPSHPDVPEAFFQIHVLNEGRLASRFFPGTGLWMAPFVALGRPYWGHWLAAALTAMFLFWTGREIGGNRLGLAAGLLTAVSPGIALFSNFLLAHLPTLAGLAAFLYAMVRFHRTSHYRDAFLAGCGLSFAMLCRPMTAAGFGLPFGIWCLVWLWGDSPALSRGARFKRLIALGLPLVAGLAGLSVYSSAVTGSWWKTPYQLYLETYTPRHVYGFNNVVRGERRLGPKTDEKYDKWAENLTLTFTRRTADGETQPSLLVTNVIARIRASLQYTLGIVPLAMGAVLCLACWKTLPVPLRLAAASILSLHVVHIPYWFVGIMHWHYVFETAPLWLLLFAWASVALCDHWRRQGMRGMGVWWRLLTAAALATNYVSLDPLWKQSRMQAAVESASFSRLRYARMNQRIDAQAGGRPVLAIFRHDPYDIHMDYVTNPPDLSGRVLKARDTGEPGLVERLMRAYPERVILYIDLRSGSLDVLRRPSNSGG